MDQGILKNKGSKNNGHHGHKFDKDIDARAGCILKRVSDGIPDNAGLVGRRTLSAVIALFDVFLGIIPSAAGIGHHNS